MRISFRDQFLDYKKCTMNTILGLWYKKLSDGFKRKGPITNKNCDMRYSDGPSLCTVNVLALILLNELEQCFPNISAPRPNFSNDNLSRPTQLYWTKKISTKKKKKLYLLLNIILQKTLSVLNNEVCVIGALVSGHC
jgi:hypothetical protein